MVTFKQMEAFYWAAKLGSISAAAGKLGTTQSTLSKRIREMEESLKTAVFDRSKRAIQLTMKGQALFGISEETLALQARIHEAVEERSSFKGTFRFGVTELIALTSLPTLVGEILKNYPKIVLQPEVGLSLDLYQMLHERIIDLAIGPKPPAHMGFAAVPIRPVEAAWMCSPALHPDNSVIPLDQIGRYPILAQTDRSGSQHLLLHWLRENGVALKRVIACNSFFALAELAAAGFGVARQPKKYFSADIRKGRLKIIRTVPPLPKMQYYAAYRSDDVSPLSAIIAQMAKRCVNPNQERGRLPRFP